MTAIILSDIEGIETKRRIKMKRTYYIYKGYDRTNTLAIIAPNVGKERYVIEVKRLNKKHGHITVRNCLGGLISEVLDNGKINSFIKQEEIK